MEQELSPIEETEINIQNKGVSTYDKLSKELSDDEYSNSENSLSSANELSVHESDEEGDDTDTEDSSDDIDHDTEEFVRKETAKLNILEQSLFQLKSFNSENISKSEEPSIFQNESYTACEKKDSSNEQNNNERKGEKSADSGDESDTEDEQEENADDNSINEEESDDKEDINGENKKEDNIHEYNSSKQIKVSLKQKEETNESEDEIDDTELNLMDEKDNTEDEFNNVPLSTPNIETKCTSFNETQLQSENTLFDANDENDECENKNEEKEVENEKMETRCEDDESIILRSTKELKIDSNDSSEEKFSIINSLKIPLSPQNTMNDDNIPPNDINYGLISNFVLMRYSDITTQSQKYQKLETTDQLVSSNPTHDGDNNDDNDEKITNDFEVIVEGGDYIFEVIVNYISGNKNDNINNTEVVSNQKSLLNENQRIEFNETKEAIGGEIDDLKENVAISDIPQIVVPLNSEFPTMEEKHSIIDNNFEISGSSNKGEDESTGTSSTEMNIETHRDGGDDAKCTKDVQFFNSDTNNENIDDVNNLQIEDSEVSQNQELNDKFINELTSLQIDNQFSTPEIEVPSFHIEDLQNQVIDLSGIDNYDFTQINEHETAAALHVLNNYNNHHLYPQPHEEINDDQNCDINQKTSIENSNDRDVLSSSLKVSNIDHNDNHQKVENEAIMESVNTGEALLDPNMKKHKRKKSKKEKEKKHGKDEKEKEKKKEKEKDRKRKLNIRKSHTLRPRRSKSDKDDRIDSIFMNFLEKASTTPRLLDELNPPNQQSPNQQSKSVIGKIDESENDLSSCSEPSLFSHAEKNKQSFFKKQASILLPIERKCSEDLSSPSSEFSDDFQSEINNTNIEIIHLSDHTSIGNNTTSDDKLDDDHSQSTSMEDSPFTSPITSPATKQLSSSSIDDVDEQKINQMKEKRRKVAIELLTTEKTYVNNLRDLLRVFYEPMIANASEDNKKISMEDVKHIFSNLRVILNINAELLHSLTERINIPEDQSINIGDIFLAQAEFLKTYTIYCNEFGNILATIKRNRKNPEFEQFFLSLHNKTIIGDQSIKDYLILPVQRIPRYKMLIMEMLKSTWKTHEDYQSLNDAYQKISDIAQFVENAQEKYSNVNKIVSIQAKLRFGKKVQHIKLLQPHRSYCKEITVDFQELSANGMIHRKGRKILIFNDAILIAKPSTERAKDDRKKRNEVLDVKHFIYIVDIISMNPVVYDRKACLSLILSETLNITLFFNGEEARDEILNILALYKKEAKTIQPPPPPPPPIPDSPLSRKKKSDHHHHHHHHRSNTPTSKNETIFQNPLLQIKRKQLDRSYDQPGRNSLTSSMHVSNDVRSKTPPGRMLNKSVSQIVSASTLTSFVPSKKLSSDEMQSSNNDLNLVNERKNYQIPSKKSKSTDDDDDSNIQDIEFSETYDKEKEKELERLYKEERVLTKTHDFSSLRNISKRRNTKKRIVNESPA